LGPTLLGDAVETGVASAAAAAGADGALGDGAITAPTAAGGIDVAAPAGPSATSTPRRVTFSPHLARSFRRQGGPHMTNRRKRNRLRRAPVSETLLFWTLAVLVIGAMAATALFAAGSV